METYSVKSHMDQGTIYDISERRRVDVWSYVITCCSAARFKYRISHAVTYRELLEHDVDCVFRCMYVLCVFSMTPACVSLSLCALIETRKLLLQWLSLVTRFSLQ